MKKSGFTCSQILEALKRVDVVDGRKVPNGTEQALLEQMRSMKKAGSSIRAIHEWFDKEQGVKLAYSSMRMKMLNDGKMDLK